MQNISIIDYCYKRKDELNNFQRYLGIGDNIGHDSDITQFPKKRTASFRRHSIPRRRRLNPSITNTNTTLKIKPPNRKKRRAKLQKLRTSNSSPLNSLDTSSNVTYLETHLWQVKRMKMKSIWGCKVPLHSSSRGLQCLRTMVDKSAAICDMSYHHAVEIKADSLHQILTLLQSFTGPDCQVFTALRDPIVNNNPDSTLTIDAGRRSSSSIFFTEYTTLFYEANQYLNNFIGPVTFLIMPPSPQSDTDTKAGPVESKYTMWLWLHPAIKTSICEHLEQVIQNNKDMNTMILNTSKLEVNRFSIVGKAAYSMMSKVFAFDRVDNSNSNILPQMNTSQVVSINNNTNRSINISDSNASNVSQIINSNIDIAALSTEGLSRRKRKRLKITSAANNNQLDHSKMTNQNHDFFHFAMTLFQPTSVWSYGRALTLHLKEFRLLTFRQIPSFLDNTSYNSNNFSSISNNSSNNKNKKDVDADSKTLSKSAIKNKRKYENFKKTLHPFPTETLSSSSSVPSSSVPFWSLWTSEGRQQAANQFVSDHILNSIKHRQRNDYLFPDKNINSISTSSSSSVSSSGSSANTSSIVNNRNAISCSTSSKTTAFNQANVNNIDEIRMLNQIVPIIVINKTMNPRHIYNLNYSTNDSNNSNNNTSDIYISSNSNIKDNNPNTIKNKIRNQEDMTENTPQWDIILPKNYASSFWKAFQFAGAKSIGLHEYDRIQLNSGYLSFPRDYPDTIAGIDYWKDKMNEIKLQDEKKPRKKRLLKYGVFTPQWDQLNEVFRYEKFKLNNQKVCNSSNPTEITKKKKKKKIKGGKIIIASVTNVSVTSTNIAATTVMNTVNETVENQTANITNPSIRIKIIRTSSLTTTITNLTQQTTSSSANHTTNSSSTTINSNDNTITTHTCNTVLLHMTGRGKCLDAAQILSPTTQDCLLFLKHRYLCRQNVTLKAFKKNKRLGDWIGVDLSLIPSLLSSSSVANVTNSISTSTSLSPCGGDKIRSNNQSSSSLPTLLEQKSESTTESNTNSNNNNNNATSTRRIIGFVTSGQNNGGSSKGVAIGICDSNQISKAFQAFLQDGTNPTSNATTAANIRHNDNATARNTVLQCLGDKDNSTNNIDDSNNSTSLNEILQLSNRKTGWNSNRYTLVMIHNPNSHWLRPALIEYIFE